MLAKKRKKRTKTSEKVNFSEKCKPLNSVNLPTSEGVKMPKKNEKTAVKRGKMPPKRRMREVKYGKIYDKNGSKNTKNRKISPQKSPNKAIIFR